MERQKLQGLPVSLECERRKVMFAVGNVEKAMQSFKEKWLRGSCDDYIDEWSEYVIKHVANGTFKKVRDWRDLREGLESLEQSEEESNTMEYVQLLVVCKRARKYEDMVNTCCRVLHEQLTTRLDQYCRSFSPEMERQCSTSVDEYEDFINIRRANITSGLVRLAEKPMIFNKEYLTMLAYIADYGKVILSMEETISDFCVVCTEYKKWVSSDEGYPNRIYLEIKKIEKYRLRVRERTRRHQVRINNNYAHKIHMKSYQVIKVQDKLQSSLGEGHLVKKQERHLQSRLQNTQTMLSDQREELAQILRSITHRKSNCQTQFDKWCHRADDLVYEIPRTEHEIERVKESVNKLQRTTWASQKDVHRLTDQVSVCKMEVEAVKSQLQEEEEEMRKGYTELRRLNRIIANLSRIRQIRLNPATVKLIYLHGYNHKDKFVKRDPVEEAFTLVAQQIGKEWSYLYQKLPFQPDRNIQARAKDVEMIDCTSRRGPNSLPVLAMKSLQKWKRLSSDVTVPSLVIALKKVNKGDIAHQLYQTIVT